MKEEKQPEEKPVVSDTLVRPPHSSLDCANEMIRQQEYLLNRQSEFNREVIRQNNKLVKIANKTELENKKLLKELAGYNSGKLWAIISSFLPAISRSDRH